MPKKKTGAAHSTLQAKRRSRKNQPATDPPTTTADAISTHRRNGPRDREQALPAKSRSPRPGEQSGQFLAQPGEAERLTPESSDLRKIFRLTRAATAVDFTQYEQTTIQQGICRRMAARGCQTLSQYAEYLQSDQEELQALSREVLAKTSVFFPEPDIFESLRNVVFPQIVASRRAGDPLRIWVPECSTGEEIYSILMVLEEYLRDAEEYAEIQAFGTDRSEEYVRKARAAIYSEAATENLSAERLGRFFLKVEGGYRISQSIRRWCIFAQHDLSRDPPLSRMDLISCRNVLSSFAPALRNRVAENFQYALKPSGFLVLSQSENIRLDRILRALEDQRVKIYSKAGAELGASQRELRSLSARLMTSAEEEGKKIARELHDYFGPTLSRLNLKIWEVAGLLSSHPEVAQQLHGIAREISDVAKSAHDLSRMLHPTVLTQLGLQTALENECVTFSKLRGIKIKFSAENVPESLPEQVALCLYRIAQECLQNIGKHAQTATASLHLARRSQDLVMTVSDLGRGFDIQTVRGGGGLGLVSMEERLRLVNGKLFVRSKPGQGTTVDVRVPLPGSGPGLTQETA